MRWTEANQRSEYFGRFWNFGLGKIFRAIFRRTWLKESDRSILFIWYISEREFFSFQWRLFQSARTHPPRSREQFSLGTWSTSERYVPENFNSRSWELHFLYLRTLILVLENLTSCTWELYFLYLRSSLLVPETFTSRTWELYFTYLTTSLLVLETFTSSTWELYFLYLRT